MTKERLSRQGGEETTATTREHRRAATPKDHNAQATDLQMTQIIREAVMVAEGEVAQADPLAQTDSWQARMHCGNNGNKQPIPEKFHCLRFPLFRP